MARRTTAPRLVKCCTHVNAIILSNRPASEPMDSMVVNQRIDIGLISMHRIQHAHFLGFSLFATSAICPDI